MKKQKWFMKKRSLPLIVACVCLGFLSTATWCGAVAIKDVKSGEDVFQYVERIKGEFDQTLYQQVIGASNAYKEGDEAIGFRLMIPTPAYMPAGFLPTQRLNKFTKTRFLWIIFKNLFGKPPTRPNTKKLKTGPWPS